MLVAQPEKGALLLAMPAYMRQVDAGVEGGRPVFGEVDRLVMDEQGCVSLQWPAPAHKGKLCQGPCESVNRWGIV